MIKCIKANIENDRDWANFLSTEYNLFFDPAFLTYNDVFKKGIKWHHLKFMDTKSNKPMAIMTGCERENEGEKIFVSCNGASYGGFLWNDKLDLIDYSNILDIFKKHCSENNFNKIVIRNPPFIYQQNPNEEYEYALIRGNFEITKNSITNIVNLRNFEFEKLSNPKKRSIKKSDTDIDVSILDGKLDYKNFTEYYNVLLKNREQKNVKPTHSMDELIYLKNKLEDKIILFSAKVDGKIAGICILFEIRKDIILNFYMATLEEYKRARVSDLVFFKSIEWAKKKGYRIYDVGTSNIGHTFLEGLFSFKKKFMASGYLRKSYELNLNKNNIEH